MSRGQRLASGCGDASSPALTGGAWVVFLLLYGTFQRFPLEAKYFSWTSAEKT